MLVSLPEDNRTSDELIRLVNPLCGVVAQIHRNIQLEGIRDAYGFFLQNSTLYHDPQPYVMGQLQFVRLPFHLLFSKMSIPYQGCGTCLDWSLFYCSLLERAGMFPVVIMAGNQQPTHAIAGCVCTRIHTGVPVRNAAAEIRELVKRGIVEPFETTSLCENFSANAVVGKQPYEVSVVAAQQVVEHSEYLRMYDIGAARDHGVVPNHVLMPTSTFANDEEVERVNHTIEEFMAELQIDKYVSLLLLYGLLQVDSGVMREVFGEKRLRLKERVVQWLSCYAATHPAEVGGGAEMTETYEAIIFMASRYAANDGRTTMRTVDLLASLVKNMDVRNYTTTFGINVFADLDIDQVKSRVYQCCAGVFPQTISL